MFSFKKIQLMFPKTLTFDPKYTSVLYTHTSKCGATALTILEEVQAHFMVDSGKAPLIKKTPPQSRKSINEIESKMQLKVPWEI